MKFSKLFLRNNKKLLGNFFSLIVLKGFQFIIPLITMPYLVNTIGIENFGLINFSLSFGLYFGSIIQFGFNITATREISLYRDDPQKVNKIYSTTLTTAILISAISFILYLIILFSIRTFLEHLNLYLFTVSFIIFRNLLPIWFFQGIERMKYITFLSLGTSILYLFGLFVFVTNKENYVLVPLLNGISSFITFLISLQIIKRQFKVIFKRPKFSEIKSVFQEGYHAFISQLAPTLYNNSTIFLLGIFTNNQTVGLYTAATKVIDAIISFAYILSNTFLPHLAREIKNHRIFRKIMILSGFVLTILAFVFSLHIAKLLFNSDSYEISLYIKSLSIGILSLFISLSFGNNFLMIVGKDKLARNISLYTSIIFFFIALLIIPSLKIWGGIITLVGARITIACTQYVYYIKYKHLIQVNDGLSI